MTPTYAHAKARAEVILPDGRHAWLFSLPSTRGKRKDSRARVVLASGHYLSVDPEGLVLA